MWFKVFQVCLMSLFWLMSSQNWCKNTSSSPSIHIQIHLLIHFFSFLKFSISSRSWALVITSYLRWQLISLLHFLLSRFHSCYYTTTLRHSMHCENVFLITFDKLEEMTTNIDFNLRTLLLCRVIWDELWTS